MDCNGLAQEWERSCEVRERLRLDKKILTHPKTQKICLPTRMNCVDNGCILFPILRRLAHVNRFRLPHLDPLQAELSQLEQKSGLKPGELSIYRTAVEIKKLCSLVKRRTNRKEVTKDRGTKPSNRNALVEKYFYNFCLPHYVVYVLGSTPIINQYYIYVLWLQCHGWYVDLNVLVSSQSSWLGLFYSIIPIYMYFSRLVHQDVRFHELILVLNPRLKDTVFFWYGDVWIVWDETISWFKNPWRSVPK